MDIPHIRTTSIIFGRRPLYMHYCPLRTMLSLPSSTLLTSAFASGRHLLMPEPSHPSHVISSFVTGTAIMSAHQEARPDSVVPPLLRQAVECGGNRDNGDSKWRQSATWRQ